MADDPEKDDAGGGALAPSADGGPLDSLPGLARIAGRAWWQTTRWSVQTSVRVSSRMARAAASGDSAVELFEEASAEMRAGARRLLGIVDGDGRLTDAFQDLVGDAAWRPGASSGDVGPSLRDRGEALLEASADVRYSQGSHPAYERMLGELAPDEARILRLFYTEGPQPAVDIRSGLAFVPGSRLVAQGFSMIAAEAGLRFGDQLPAYLNNLNRLGLIWFAHEPVTDRSRYQVLEVQPDVSGALKEAGRFSHIIRRSIHLTPMGRDFCNVSLPVDTAEFAALGSQPEAAPDADGDAD